MAIQLRKAKRTLSYLDEKPTVFHMEAIRPGTVDLDTLLQEIAHSENVNETQTNAVVLALINRVAHYLSLNYNVCVQGLGSFRLMVSAKVAKTGKAANLETVRKVSVRFSPGKALRDVAKSIELIHYGGGTLDDEE